MTKSWNWLHGKSLLPSPGDLVTAGLVDLQVNGFAGVDFNHPSLTAEEVDHACAALMRTGVAYVFPTVITASPERMEHLFRVLQSATHRFSVARAMIAGFHLEGPFLAPGAHGAHPRQHLRLPDATLFARLQRAAGDRIRIVTLAPELPRAVEFIRKMAARGIIVAIGHTLAGSKAIARAVAAGARLSTHLGNGLPSEIHRHQNPLWPQLADDRLTADVIPDGIHVPQDFLRTCLKAKGPNRLILTTDCMAAAGAVLGKTYTLGDLSLTVGKDRVVRMPGHANFAGSALTLDEGLVRFSRMTGLDFSECVPLASRNPAQLLGIAVDRLQGRCLWRKKGPNWTLVAVR